MAAPEPAPSAWSTGGCVLRCAGASQTPQKVQEQLGAWKSSHALQRGTSSDAAHCPPRVEGTADPHISGSHPGRDIPACEKRQKAIFRQHGNRGLIPSIPLPVAPVVFSATCSLASASLLLSTAQHGHPASLYPRSSGTAAGSMTVTLGNVRLGLLGAGRAYLHRPSCPVWGPGPTLQALLSTQVSCSSGVRWWGGNRDEHIQQNLKAHPFSPGEPCRDFQPFPATRSLTSPRGADCSASRSRRGVTGAGTGTRSPPATLSQPGGRGWPSPSCPRTLAPSLTRGRWGKAACARPRLPQLIKFGHVCKALVSFSPKKIKTG